jgi:hypothetical protein
LLVIIHSWPILLIPLLCQVDSDLTHSWFCTNPPRLYNIDTMVAALKTVFSVVVMLWKRCTIYVILLRVLPCVVHIHNSSAIAAVVRFSLQFPVRVSYLHMPCLPRVYI